jgi:tetratricopeptide (TPR) repeat protein
MKRYRRLFFFFCLPAIGFILYSLPPLKERVDWRLVDWRAKLQYALFPPEEVIFQPNPSAVAAVVTPTSAAEKTSTPPLPTTTLIIERTAVPTNTDAPTLTPTSLPAEIQLTGITYERQGWNNCGPATLAMALSYWGWSGDQYNIAPYTKPNDRDKNVMPYEMVDYVNTQTELRAISRLAGSVDLLKRFVAAGFPVVIEKGLEGPDFDGWMGHYELITGYDDALSLFTAEDSYMGSGLKLPYTVIESYWRAFNGAYIIVYPISREQEMLALLGDHAQEGYNRQFAAQLALEESTVLAGRDQFFALFNRGSSLVSLLDYAGAASAYDQAFALYPSIPQKERPWRMMWYQTGPYWAYYYTGRYQDVVDLATKTLDNMSEPVLEESYYWRGLAFDALGDRQKAIEDLQMSEKTHPGFLPAVEQMRQLGVEGK